MNRYDTAMPSLPKGARHPFLVWLACIALADRIVPVVWHSGFRHPRRCTFARCQYPVYQAFSLYNTSMPVLGVLLWRRQTLFGHDGKNDQHSRYPSHRIAWALTEGAMWWEISPRAKMIHPEQVLADLRSLARGLGMPEDPPMLAQVRAYLAGVLEVIVKEDPSGER